MCVRTGLGSEEMEEKKEHWRASRQWHPALPSPGPSGHPLPRGEGADYA